MKKTGSMNVPAAAYDKGTSVIVINHDTKEIMEFEDFMMVGFASQGEFVANNCTLPQLSHGLLRLHERNDELKASDEKLLKELNQAKSKLIIPKNGRFDRS